VSLNYLLVSQKLLRTPLPVDGVVEVRADGSRVHTGDEQQVDTHAEVCERQVTHEELGDSHTEVRAEQYQQNSQVAHQRCDGHQPHSTSQPPVAHQVLARVERVGFRAARHVPRRAGKVATVRLDQTLVEGDRSLVEHTVCTVWVGLELCSHTEWSGLTTKRE